MKAYRLTRTENQEIILLGGGVFETVNYRDTYGDYGQKLTSEDAEDYSLDNYYCNALHEEFKEAIAEKYKVEGEIEFDASENSCSITVDDDDFEVEGLEAFIEKWREENENITECEAYTYWDGNNYQSLILSVNTCAEYNNIEEVEGDLNKQILEEYESVSFDDYEYGVCLVETETFIFRDSQFAGTFTEVQYK